jgi:hypothetical protein
MGEGRRRNRRRGLERRGLGDARSLKLRGPGHTADGAVDAPVARSEREASASACGERSGAWVRRWRLARFPTKRLEAASTSGAAEGAAGGRCLPPPAAQPSHPRRWQGRSAKLQQAPAAEGAGPGCGGGGLLDSPQSGWKPLLHQGRRKERRAGGVSRRPPPNPAVPAGGKVGARSFSKRLRRKGAAGPGCGGGGLLDSPQSGWKPLLHQGRRKERRAGGVSRLPPPNPATPAGGQVGARSFSKRMRRIGTGPLRFILPLRPPGEDGRHCPRGCR